MADPQKQYDDFYNYAPPLPFSNIAVGGNATQTIAFQADADFLITKLSYYINIANATNTNNTLPVPNLSVLITDTGSGRQFMNVAVPVANLFGTAQNPFILPVPKLILARSTLQIQVFNFDAAIATYQLYLNFIGMKKFVL